ncbi:Zinc finger BED domain-containing protein 4 [Merluccius polli]|uniref:Zinc finger BED domain-containing protein 4 n=1 Tax=Merluccius polli TaxID=89951 RepID=A0AA47MXA0_MERPO|nr:Zinc finger BED domain-containing protein 4 [Merluccius polli]
MSGFGLAHMWGKGEVFINNGKHWDQYLREPLIDRQTGQPLEWWKQNASRFHLLAPLARKFLCPPPSSVPSERVFSEVSQIYEKKRNRLMGENAERLCFLHYNLQLLNWEY